MFLKLYFKIDNHYQNNKQLSCNLNNQPQMLSPISSYHKFYNFKTYELLGLRAYQYIFLTRRRESGLVREFCV